MLLSNLCYVLLIGWYSLFSVKKKSTIKLPDITSIHYFPIKANQWKNKWRIKLISRNYSAICALLKCFPCPSPEAEQPAVKMRACKALPICPSRVDKPHRALHAWWLRNTIQTFNFKRGIPQHVFFMLWKTHCKNHTYISQYWLWHRGWLAEEQPVCI